MIWQPRASALSSSLHIHRALTRALCGHASCSNACKRAACSHPIRTVASSVHPRRRSLWRPCHARALAHVCRTLTLHDPLSPASQTAATPARARPPKSTRPPKASTSSLTPALSHQRVKSGVTCTPDRRWQARLHNNGEVIHLGFFASEAEATKAYSDAALLQRAKKGGKVHCICQKPATADVNMIQCEACDKWQVFAARALCWRACRGMHTCVRPGNGLRPGHDAPKCACCVLKCPGHVVDNNVQQQHGPDPAVHADWTRFLHAHS